MVSDQGVGVVVLRAGLHRLGYGLQPGGDYDYGRPPGPGRHEDGGYGGGRASYSNYGARVDLAAPGGAGCHSPERITAFPQCR